VGQVGGGPHVCSRGPDGPGSPVVDVCRGLEAESAVVLVVVPGKKSWAVRAGGFDRGEPGGEGGPVFQGLELGFGVRVVVGDVGPGVGLGDAEVGEQKQGFGGATEIQTEIIGRGLGR
jgi:hypothetical protein